MQILPILGLMWMMLRRVDAGKVELDGARYLNFNLPFSISQLVWIEAILVGGAEIYRNRELDPETRIYPGTALLARITVSVPCVCNTTTATRQ